MRQRHLSARGRAALQSPVAEGFTLVELMVTIMVATILMSIAIPAYTSQIRKSRRTDARVALLDLASREERYFSTQNAYTSSAANLGYAGSFPQTVGSGYYTVSVCVGATNPCTGAAATGSVFRVTATPTGPQANDTQCATFSVDNTGAQTATNTTCWN
jgi:type IV pilus assembly protein PilE